MQKRLITLLFGMAFVGAACGGGDGSPVPGATGPAGTGPAGTGPAATRAGFDPDSIEGEVNLGIWESSPAEGTALEAAIDAFEAAYPNITVNQETISGDYRAQMVNRFGAGDPPDLFYVNAEYAPEWMRDGFLLSLDDYIAKSGFDTEPFFDDYLSIFQQDGVTYGLPKDGNTIAMAYNTDLVSTAPATIEELITTVDGLKGNADLQAPMCLNPSLDRGLAFLYAQGGSLLTEDNTAAAIDSAESTAAVQWYMDLWKNGQGMHAPAGDWCGSMLGKEQVAIAFEGGWLKGAMDNEYPDTNWAFAEMPTGSLGEKVTINYTAAYGIGADSENKDQAWVLMQYLTGVDGMTKWTEGGIAAPSRDDVPVPEGFEVIVAGAEYARPGSGFMPGYSDVLKAFGDEFLKQVTDETYDAAPVVAATKAKIDEVIAE
jgi:multiple sugar transport system substrate-binding protein